MTQNKRRLWIQEKRTYIIHCWKCQVANPIDTIVDLANDGNPDFPLGNICAFLSKNLPDGWHFEKTSVTGIYGVEIWENRFFCHACWLLQPVKDS